MGELPWLDYSGQSVDELLALEGKYRIDSLVIAFEEAIQRKEARDGSEVLALEEQTILAIEALEREVNNGGYHQFFVNSMEYAPIIIDSLRRIGCPKVAAITKDAIDALRLSEVSTEEIEKVIYDDDSLFERLGACDSKFFEYPESIQDQLFSYIKRNKTNIGF